MQRCRAPAAIDEAVNGGYFHALYRFGPEAELQFEPAVAYDILNRGDLLHRATGGLNVHFWDTGFYSSVNYQLWTSDIIEQHAVLFRLTGVI